MCVRTRLARLGAVCYEWTVCPLEREKARLVHRSGYGLHDRRVFAVLKVPIQKSHPLLPRRRWTREVEGEKEGPSSCPCC